MPYNISILLIRKVIRIQDMITCLISGIHLVTGLLISWVDVPLIDLLLFGNIDCTILSVGR